MLLLGYKYYYTIDYNMVKFMVASITKFFQKVSFRLVVYALLTVAFVGGIYFLYKSKGISIFYENALVGNIQIFLLVLAAVSFGWQAQKHNKLRPLMVLLTLGCLWMLYRKLNFVFGSFFSYIRWYFVFLFFALTLVYVYIHRKSTLHILSSFTHVPVFGFWCVLAFALMFVAEMVEDDVIGTSWEEEEDLGVLYAEIIEDICYLLLFISSLEIDFNKSKVLDKLYAMFGEDISFGALSSETDKVVYNVNFENVENTILLSEKKNKIVYAMKSKQGEFVLINIPHITVTKFYKYMCSLGLQKQLFADGMDVAEIVEAYIQGDNIVSVHRRFKGTDNFASYEEMLKVSGKVYGKLHRITMAPKYKKTFLLLKYPNIFVRGYMFVRYVLNRQLSQYIKYYKLRKLPWGICHRDNNGKNVLFDENGHTVLLDFDKHRYMPLVEGLIYFYNKHLKDKSLFPIFLKAYEGERPLTKEEREYLNKTLNIKV